MGKTSLPWFSACVVPAIAGLVGELIFSSGSLTKCYVVMEPIPNKLLQRCPSPMPETKQLNVRIEPEHESLARETIGRLRRGGSAFREALAGLLRDDMAAIYMPASEIRSRLDNLEARIGKLERGD